MKEFFDIFNLILSNPLMLISLGIGLFSIFVSSIHKMFVSSDLHIEDSTNYFDNNEEDDETVIHIPVELNITKEIPCNCVNCGAPLNGRGICEYCGTKY